MADVGSLSQWFQREKTSENKRVCVMAFVWWRKRGVEYLNVNLGFGKNSEKHSKIETKEVKAKKRKKATH